MQVGPYTLHPYQERTYLAVRQEVARLLAAGLPPRVIVQAPCGAGKTILSSAWMSAAAERGKRSLFLAHGRQLISQKSEKLQQCGLHHSVLMAGEQYGIAPVVVASKDTYWSRAFEGDRVLKMNPDLIIVDEAHISHSNTWLKILKHTPKAVVIGMTATPSLGTGKGLSGFYQSIVVGATYAELINDDFLCPVRVFAPYAVDMKGVAVGVNGEYSQPQAAERFQTLIGDAVDQWKKYAEDRPTGVFASSVAHSIALAEEFNAAGIPAAHIDAETESYKRSEYFDRIKDGSLKVICNYGVMRIGVDLPILSCGQLMVSMNSLTAYIQTCGRFFRTYPGKPDAIIIDHGGNVYKHGWPTEDREWSLDAEGKVQERDAEKKERENKPREPICCPNCGAMRESGPQCTHCGHKHVRNGMKIRTSTGELKQVEQKTLKKEKKDDLQKLWMMCLGVAANRGQHFYSAMAIFKGRTGKWPPDLKMTPMPDLHQLRMKVADVFPGFARKK